MVRPDPIAVSRRGWIGNVCRMGQMTGLTLAAWQSGCAIDLDSDHTGPNAPSVGPLRTTPRVAWVLGSGGPRGFVHVGVLKALAELKLKPDLIVGASVGALVGTLFAAGLRANEIERLALELQPALLLRWQPGSTERFSGAGIASFVNSQVDGLNLQSLPIAMVCVVQRLRDGAVLGFNQGDTGLAVQAAAAIEGQFTPVRIRGERYADADLRMPLPVRLARSLGATRVLAVDTSAHEDRRPAGADRYAASDSRKRAMTRPDAESADLLLHPEFGYWASVSTEYRQRVIVAGYAATMAQAAGLKALHAT